MESSFTLLSICASAIGFFSILGRLLLMVFRKIKSSPQNETTASNSFPSSPLSSPPSWKYDLFPSFHGADVRRSFVSHVLREFQMRGIVWFTEIRRGVSLSADLIEALRESKIAIVVLSRNYASSSWCLNELVEIMKCRKELGQTVVTVFYEVDPSDVKKQTGDFGKVFRRTCKGKKKEEIGRWRQALTEVAIIAGYHSRTWNNEAAMIEAIANDISYKLSTFNPSNNIKGLVGIEDLEPDEDNIVEEEAIVTQNNSAPSSDFDSLVGMDAHIEKVEQILCLDSDEVKMIGISGPCGIGKTTIAKCLYQEFSHQFQLSTIMTNIKRCYASNCPDKENGKSQLQIQFCSQLISQKDSDGVFHLGAAQEMLKDKKVFVILDDVDELGQLDALVEEMRSFGPGSRIIIITRDQGFLKAYGIDHIYKVDYPLPDEALQIFCIYAFGQKSPDEGFMELAQEVTTLCGRLPKGLWFMGTYLYGMPKQYWTNELPRLRTSLDGQFDSILKFSSVRLWGEEKKSSHLIESSFSSGDCNETVEEYSANSFSDVRQELIITNQDLQEDLYTSERALEAISGFIRWESFPLTCWPPELDPENLVELYMPDSKFEQLWEGIRHLGKLTLMDLSSSKNLKQLPDLSTAINLKRLDLKCCSSLVELPDSIGDATSLLILNLEYCSSLVDLPTSIGNATNLRRLHLTGCLTLVELPSSLGKATNLQELELNCCSSLVELPTSIGDATNLRKLNLEHCSKLVTLPSSIGNAKNLKELNLSGCSSMVELPESIGNATNIEILDLSICSSLKELPSSIGNVNGLHYLYLSNCSSLVKIPSSIENVTNLWELDLGNCRSLVELPSSIGNATNLRKLNLSNCSRLVELPFSIGNATNLEYLYLSNCSSLLHLPYSIGYATSLQYLYLDNCSNLLDVPASIGNVTKLKKLDLSWCTSLVELPDSIRNSKSLWQLNLDHCPRLLEIPSSTGNGVRLKKLDLSWCTSLVEEQSVEILSSTASDIRYTTF